MYSLDSTRSTHAYLARARRDSGSVLQSFGSGAIALSLAGVTCIVHHPAPHTNFRIVSYGPGITVLYLETHYTSTETPAPKINKPQNPKP